MKNFLKNIFPGVSWQNPFINIVFKSLNPLDYLIRSARGLHYLPNYSIRVRSNGITKQFGGKRFDKLGQTLAHILQNHAGLVRTSEVLEIGCGCGRTAFALADILDEGRYVGMDIDKPSLNSVSKNPYFFHRNFKFDYLDVKNNEYNPTGIYPANEYRFPYKDGEYDIIFLVSVFTHMLTDDVRNYISEISRMLKNGGTCMITTFLMDKGRNWDTFSFTHKDEEHYFFNETMPEIAIGYDLSFYENIFSSLGLEIKSIEWGSWRGSQHVKSTSGFSQDIIFLRKTPH